MDRSNVRWQGCCTPALAMPQERRDRERAEIRGHAAEQRILEALGAVRPLPEILGVVVEGLEEQLQNAMCAILLERQGRLKLCAQGSVPDDLAAALDGLGPTTICPSLGAEPPVPLIVPDIEGAAGFPLGEMALRNGVRSFVGVPIRSPGGMLGVVAVHRRVAGPPRAWELELAGRAAGIAGILAERAASEDRLRESELRLRQIAESLREGIWISTADHRPLYISPSCVGILGIPLEEMYENGLAFLDIVHPADRSSFEAALAGDDEIDRDFRVIRRDGELRWLHTRIVPIRDHDGAVHRSAGVLEDVTEWRRMVEALRESETHYRRLVTAAPVGIYAIDLEGRFTEINPVGEAILDRPAAEVIGRHFAELVVPSDLELTNAAFQRLAGGSVSRETLEISIARPSGELRLVTLTISPIVEDGNVTGMHGIGSDITDERQRDLQLRRAERLASVGTLIGGVAHELNNPLTAIRGLSELMLGDDRSDDDREVLGMIRRESERMAKIVADLRRLAQQTQESERECRPVDLNELVYHVLRIRRYTLQTSNVEVVEELDQALPRVWANPAEIEQVLLNLVVNAEQALVEADVPDKRVVIRTRRADQCVALHVVDNGPGIPQESIERIFDPFFTTKAPGGGTGLGLSLVNNIVREHGGRVHAYSPPANGAEFVVELPIARSGRADEPRAEPGHEDIESLRVLVVEDERAIQALVRRMLGRRGHVVTVASDGAEALHRLESPDPGPRFDVILSDLRMPGLSGQELLRRLREHGQDAADRVVFMTGDAVGDASAHVFEDAGVPVLMKPFTSEQLIELVERVAQEQR